MIQAERPGVPSRWPAITWILLGVLALRLAHLATSFDSPLFWKGGPDEEFYRDFARDVAYGRFGMSAEFAFMDPLYGYLLGAVFWIFGDSLVPVYLLQVAIDTLTAWMLWRIGCVLGNPRAGLLAAALHGLTATALLFSLSLMKATWVAATVTGWIWLALLLVDQPSRRRWLCMGLLLGLAVALRANLLLLVLASIFLLPGLAWARRKVGARAAAAGALLMVLGLAPMLGLLAARNAYVSGQASITPNNGGVVLHHVYNPENPRAASGVPSFVGYAHPREIWRSYVAEAERRLARPLEPAEVNDYWQAQALAYLLTHPVQSLRNGLRKAGEFIAWPEVPNNRSFEDERRFAPLLRRLPSPFGWLFALGAPGLLLWLGRDRRALVPLAALASGLATVMIFFAEDRFRFNVITPFTLGAGWLLASAVEAWRDRRWRWLVLAAIAVITCAGLSLGLARNTPVSPLNWERVAWGYVLMGKPADAARWVERIGREQPDAIGLEEFRGFFALRRGEPERALAHLDRALALRTRHEVLFNRSLAREQLGMMDEAIADVSAALAISEQPDYLLRLVQLLHRAGRETEAAPVLDRLLYLARDNVAYRPYAELALRESTPGS